MTNKLRSLFSVIAIAGTLFASSYASGMSTISDQAQDSIPAGWTTDYKAALNKAKTENKDILIDFTGSDWCGWCIKLHKQVLDKPEFTEYAKKNLILLYLDYPRNKAQSTGLKAQNDTLAKKYAIKSFPTIMILNPEGKKIGKLGYIKGGPKAFIKAIEKISKDK